MPLNSPETISLHVGNQYALKYPSPMLLEAIKEVPMENRETQRKLAFSLGVSTTVVQRALKRDLFRPHSNHLKPALQEHHQQARIGFALAMRDDADAGVYSDMMDIVHIDEKWFYIDKKRSKYTSVLKRNHQKGVL
jgi:hypothetical protein